MNILITPFHGLSNKLKDRLNSFAQNVQGDDKKRAYWKLSNTTLEDFMEKWKSHFLVYPIKVEDRHETFYCDYLIYVTEHSNFNTR